MPPQDNAIVPTSNQPQPQRDLVCAPDEVTFEGITEKLRDDKLSWLDKCVMVREKAKALIAHRKQQFAGALKTAELATAAEVNMAVKAIKL